MIPPPRNSHLRNEAVSVSRDDILEYTQLYTNQYPISPPELHIKIWESSEQYKQEYALNLASTIDAKGGYCIYDTPREISSGCHGRIDIIEDSLMDILDLVETLNHEILGHYGLNTLRPSEKKLLLDSILISKDELKPLWDYVSEVYTDARPYMQAEEVFCYLVEPLEPEEYAHTEVNENGKTVIDRLVNRGHEKLTLIDLKNVALMIAKGINEQTRHQQTFRFNDMTTWRFAELEKEINPPPLDIDLEM